MNQEICKGKLIKNKRYVLNGEIYKGNFVDHNGFAIVQGDIILGKTEDVLKFSKFLKAYKDLSPQQKNACIVKKNLWDTKEIPYCIEDGHSKTADIHTAIATFNSAKLNVSFREKKSEDKDYVEFVKGDGCSSYIGKTGGKQKITLSDKAKVGNILHEMLHACGIAHEHCRNDRDIFIQINSSNIKPDRKHNFIISSGDVFGTYDYESIMHYSAKAFTKNGKDTISIKPGHGEHPNMGQRDAMTATDMDGVKELYK